VVAPRHPLKVALRVDAEARTGFGHLVRTVAVGRALAERGAECVILARAAPDALPFRRVDLSRTPLADALAAERPDLLLADLFAPSEPELAALRHGPWALALLDDDCPLFIDCDLLVNPNLDPAFRHRLPPHSRYLRGAEVVILREQFQNLPPRATRPTLARLAVCFGGTDPVDATRRALPLLAANLPDTVEDVTVVVGAGYPHRAALEAAWPADPRLHLAVDHPDMAGLLAAADAGLLAAGTLLYEACATGLPAAFVSLTPGQAREADTVAQAGAALHLGPPDRLDAATLARALAALAPPAARAELARRAQSLIDGRGLTRVTEALLALAPR
jgi:spore coat polysaccharide biosynthesis predicted glycosyltransferase SpsG